MDLVRLGLERGGSAEAALELIVDLLEAHGQGGACAENDPGFSYHNSFLIAAAGEAWVLETAGCHWVAERVVDGMRNISNGLSIRENFDRASDGLEDHARALGLHGGSGPLDFAAAFSLTDPEPDPWSREGWGRRLMEDRAGRITPDTMKELLRHHDSGICMHGAFETTASMVSHLKPNGESRHWLTTGPNPCTSRFEEAAPG